MKVGEVFPMSLLNHVTIQACIGLHSFTMIIPDLEEIKHEELFRWMRGILLSAFAKSDIMALCASSFQLSLQGMQIK